MPDRRIYLLSPRDLSPETIAVAFAKTSRSPESFEEIAAGLTDEKSAQFHEKWVVGYGHASVAEHAVLHVAVENVSRLAIESIESNRLASYTEKSTRYQKWNLEDFLVPPELAGQAARGLFVETCRLLFKTYHESLEPVRRIVLERARRRENESDEALDRRVRSQYVDVCRFLLPAASLANVGVTANARVLEHTIRKMLSHPLAEVRLIGEQIKAAARAEVPTLVKYADAVPYLSELPGAFGAQAVPERALDDWCSLIDYDRQAEDGILAAALYRFGGASYAATLAQVGSLDASERKRLAGLLLGGLAEHDTPLRELEYADYTFDLVMDQGAYAEFKRHRMMTQTPQLLTTRLGFVTPRLIVDAGIQPAYQAAMQAAATAYAQLAEFDPQVAQYVVPNGYNRRVLARFNLREAWHFCGLRGAPNAHFSIRRIAHRIAGEIRRVHPLLTQFMPLPDETWQAVEDRHLVK
jgi:thymidylate synthase ThyX